MCTTFPELSSLHNTWADGFQKGISFEVEEWISRDKGRSRLYSRSGSADDLEVSFLRVPYK